MGAVHVLLFKLQLDLCISSVYVWVCMHSLLHHYSLKFNGAHTVQSLLFCVFNQLSLCLLPFNKQIFRFPNEDSKISYAKRDNTIYALAKQKIDNNKKVHFTQKKDEEGGKNAHTHTHAQACAQPLRSHKESLYLSLKYWNREELASASVRTAWNPLSPRSRPEYYKVSTSI